MNIASIPIALMPIALSVLGIKFLVSSRTASEEIQRKMKFWGRLMLVSGILSGIGEICLFFYFLIGLNAMN